MSNCEVCGKEFHNYHGNMRFCSNECYTSQNTGENNGMYKGKIKYICKVCGKEFLGYPSTKHRKKYCSNECRHKSFELFYSNENSKNWKGGSISWYGSNWEEQRRKAMERDNFTCQDCGVNIDGLEDSSDMVVHHKIPFRYFEKDYIKANDLSNLTTYCRKCHGKQESHHWSEEYCKELITKKYGNPEPSIA